MDFELLTLAGVKYKGEAKQVSLVTAEGEVGILPHHENLTAIVMPGPITILTKGKPEVFASFGGLLEVTPYRVRVLADEAEHENDLIESEVEAALARAEQLKASAKDKIEMAKAQQMVDRQAVRLGVARMRRHRASRPVQ